MSPALIDNTRTPPKPPLSFLSNPNPKNNISQEQQQSSNNFNNKFMSGFDYTFASQSDQKFRSNSTHRSVPRLVKVRKQRSRSSIPENQVPVDFNPFVNREGEGEGSVRVRDETRFQELFDKYNNDQNQNSQEFEFGKSDDLAFVFGTNLNLNSEDKSGIDEDMMNLNIGKDVAFSSNVKKTNDFVFGSSNISNSNSNPVVAKNAEFKLEDEIIKLNIKGVANVDPVSDKKKNEFVFGGRRREVKGLNKDVDLKNSKLPDIMRNLNIKESGDGDTDVKFQPKVGNRGSFVFGNNGNASSVLPDEMKKLNVDDLKGGNEFEETVGNHVKEDTANVFVFGSMNKDIGSSSMSSIGILPDEMSKLNMGSKIRNASVSQDTTASTFSAQPKVSSDKLFNDVATGNTTTEPFSFQATKPSKSSSVDALHSDQANDDSKLSGDSTSSNSFHSANLSFQSSAGSDRSVQQNGDSKSSGASTSSYSFHSAGLSFQSPEYMSEEPSAGADKAADKAEFDFATPHMEFTTPMQDVLFSSTTNIFSGLNQKLEFSAKKGAANDTRSKKKKGKTRQSVKVPLWAGQHGISSESSFQEHAESSGGYSPMDVSPYHETSYADQSSRGASVTSLDAIDEDLISATETLNINKDGVVFEESKEESMGNFEKGRSEVFVSGVEHGVLRSKTTLDTGNDANVAATERDTRPHSDTQSKGNDKSMEFCFASSSEDSIGTNFTFSASNSAQEHASAAKRQYKKKVRQKPGQDSYISTLNSKLQFAATDIPFSPLPGRSSNPVMGQNKQEDSSVYQFMEEKKTETIEVPKVKQDSTTRASTTAVAHEVCEKWRLRGNQAYANGNLSKAEDYYTRGLNCIPKNETSEACLTALTLCYSNRAAARMSSGRIRAALDDCKKAAEINPNFRKVQVRAANCYLALGEIEDALRLFQSALPPGADLCLDRKLVIEASNGQQKAERAHEYFNRCGELLRKRTSGDAETALQILAEALLISPYSEKLVEMKAEALLLVRKYEDVIQICEQSLDFADKNSSPNAGGSEGTKNFAARLWRWHLMAKSYFYMGKLEEALSYLEKLEQAESVTLKFGSKTADSSSTLAVTLRELLRHKAAGNEAFQSGRHSEAVEHYTSALSRNLESRPFAAICFCNRAAAFQALGQIADAIADCSFAIALDANYPKAISRRATLHEMIRDYSHAAIDLQRLVSLLEIQTDEKSNKSGRLSRSTSGNLDVRQAQTRLSILEEESRKGISLNFYLILGIESTGVASDIKKAYRKSALRHHPDKAAQVLPRSENGDDGVWKEIADVVYKDADRLFKMIGEAYAVLSDPVKRFQYDEEELRFTKRGSGCSTSRTQSDVYNSPFDRSDSRRHWQEVRRSYRAHYSQYPDGSRSERYF